MQNNSPKIFDFLPQITRTLQNTPGNPVLNLGQTAFHNGIKIKAQFLNDCNKIPENVSTLFLYQF